MGRLRSAFELDVFERRNAKSERLSAFLAIYVQHFGPEHRTKTNELIEFLALPPADRTITYFGLTYDGVPCGFATFMYYAKGPFGIVDHLVLAPTVRGYGAFFSFCDLITRYLENRRVVFDHILAEVMLREKQIASPIKPVHLLRLMRMVGFRIAKVPYWAPDPTLATDLDSCKAALLIASQPEREDMPAEEFNRLVKIIYCDHYQGWYGRTMGPDEFARYKKVTDEVLEIICKFSLAKKRVKLNGMKNIDLHFVVDPNPLIDLSSSIYIALLLFPAIIGLAVAFAQERWVSITAAMAVTCFLTLFTFHPRLRHFLLKFFRLSE